MQLTIHIPDETVALLELRGVEISTLVEEALAREAQCAGNHDGQELVAQAIDRMLERRERLSLGGLNIRNLIDEGRKY